METLSPRSSQAEGSGIRIMFTLAPFASSPKELEEGISCIKKGIEDLEQC